MGEITYMKRKHTRHTHSSKKTKENAMKRKALFEKINRDKNKDSEG